MSEKAKELILQSMLLYSHDSTEFQMLQDILAALEPVESEFTKYVRDIATNSPVSCISKGLAFELCDKYDSLEAENKVQSERINRLSRVVSLLNSMVLGGEKHSEQSQNEVEQALKEQK